MTEKKLEKKENEQEMLNTKILSKAKELINHFEGYSTEITSAVLQTAINLLPSASAVVGYEEEKKEEDVKGEE